MKRWKMVLENKQENYMMPFFWQHGETEEVLREYMEAIQSANIGAVCVESRPHPDFMGEKWWQDMDVILDEAKKRKMKVWILDDSHFPTGFANGAVKTAPKELHHKYLCYRTLEMAGPVKHVEFSLKEYMRPVPPPPWMPPKPVTDDDFADDRLMKICACKVLPGGVYDEPVDLTGNICSDKVIFDLAEGYYRIFVIYVTRNGKGRNDYINFLDRKSCRLLIDAVYEPHYEHYKEYFGNVIAGFFSDEPPVGNVEGYSPAGMIGSPGEDLPWSDEAADRMNQLWGSEQWQSLLPYLWGDALDKTQQARIRNGYMDVVTQLVKECFSQQNGEWCQAHGVEYIGHMLEDCDNSTHLGPSMGHFFRGLAGQHMAGIDDIGGQVMIGGQDVSRNQQGICQDDAGFYQYMLGKMGASAGAIDPKKKGRCLCEIFGAYGWQLGLKEQKHMLDHFLVRGVNRFVPHAFSPAAFPDPDCPPHFYAHGENPAYRAFGKLMGYANRVSHLLDGGKPCPDVALLYNAETVWAGNETSNIPACRALTQAQVDFHIIPADVFAGNGEYPVKWKDNKLWVNGISYRALVISGGDFLDGNVAEFVKMALLNEFPVIFTDQLPSGMEDCAVVPAELIGRFVKKLLGDSVNTRIQPENPLITTYHYQVDGHDEYFVFNEMSGAAFDGKVMVEAAGIPVRYDAWENSFSPVSYESGENGKKEIRLKIEPLELCMILFLKEEKELKELNVQKNKVDMTGNEENSERVSVSEFEVGLVEGKEYLAQLEQNGEGLYPKQECVHLDHKEKVQAPFDGLQDKYPDFSGYCIYETLVNLEKGVDYELEIEYVSEAAEVFVNGMSLGMKIQSPFCFQIPKELVKNQNKIRIETSTLLERKVHAMGVNLNCMWSFRPMSPVGIVGEVTINRREASKNEN